MIRRLVPHEMEEKWFIFYVDGWLCFHRSWSGFGIHQAQLCKEQQGYSIKEFLVEKITRKNDIEDLAGRKSEKIAIT